ncbi:hypothetical protein ACFL44_00845 [Gemmatimonadota bacterium]
MKRTIQMVGATAILVIAVTVHAQQVQAQQIENVEAAEAYNQARTLYQEGNYDEAGTGHQDGDPAIDGVVD